MLKLLHRTLLLRALLLLTSILRTCQHSSAPLMLSTALSCTAPLTKGTRRNFQRKRQRCLLCLRVRLIVCGEDVSHGHSEPCRDDGVVFFQMGFLQQRQPQRQQKWSTAVRIVVWFQMVFYSSHNRSDNSSGQQR